MKRRMIQLIKIPIPMLAQVLQAKRGRMTKIAPPTNHRVGTAFQAANANECIAEAVVSIDAILDTLVERFVRRSRDRGAWGSKKKKNRICLKSVHDMW